jgi:Ser/Thr protein kinase RdoA (MazF antagonist)
LPPGGGACVRPAGSWHHLSVNGGSRRDDVEILIALVRDKQTRTPRDERPLLDELCAELASLDELEDLPMTLTHPDPCRANLVADDAGDGVLVDWTGAGRGPRVGSFAALVWSLTSFAHIDAAVAGYREHSSLDDRELGRLEGALVGFPAVLLAWGLLFREQLSVGDVLHTMSTQRERAARIADHVRSAWTAPVHAEAAPVGRQESLF